MVFLLKNGAFNVTISSGSPGNWQNDSINSGAWPSANSEDYYKWHEVSVEQTTQYLEVNFSQAGSYNTVIAEIAVIDQNNQQVTIQSINDLGSGNLNLHNLVDEQNMVQYPSDLHVRTRILMKFILLEQQSNTCICSCHMSGRIRRLGN